MPAAHTAPAPIRFANALGQGAQTEVVFNRAFHPDAA